MEAGYSLRAAEQRDLASVPRIERRAAKLFRGHGLPEVLLEETSQAGALDEAMRERRLFVAVDAGDRPVGFARAEDLGGSAHLEELDVDPDHGRKGIGAALVGAVCHWAREEGYEHVTLTAFSDVPWNAPFYARLGFHELAGDELSVELRERVAEEGRRGLDPARRIVMRRRVARSRRPFRALAGLWLFIVVTVSAMASTRIGVEYLHWVRDLPGRDKTGHFALMGVLAFAAIRAFSRTRVGGRRVGTPGVLAAVVAFVLAEELLQIFLPQRTFSLIDLAYSLAGVASFSALAIWLGRGRGGA